MELKKVVFKDLPSTDTPIDANNLNTIQNNTNEALNNLEEQIQANTNDISTMIESGNDSNGEYIKFANGMLICSQKVTIPAFLQTQWGNVWDARFGELPKFAHKFISTPSVSMVSNNLGCFVEYVKSNNERIESGYICKPLQGMQTENYTFDVIAVGKWK